MHRLSDGVIAIVRSVPEGGQIVAVCDVTTLRAVAVPAPLVPEVLRLALGMHDAPTPALVDALGEGFVSEADRMVDPVLRERLGRLDRCFEWMLAPAIESPRMRELWSSYVDAHAARKVIRLDLLQVPLVPAAGFMRAATIGHREERLRCLMVGDDDLLSIPLASMGHQVTVLDVDPWILAYLRGHAERHGLDIRVIHGDMLDPFPARLEQAFDVVCSDPPHDPKFWNALVHRGLRCLRPEGRMFVSIGQEMGRLMSDVTQRLGGSTETVLRRISHYYAPGTMDLEQGVEDVLVLRPPADLGTLLELSDPCPDLPLEDFGVHLDFCLDMFDCDGPSTADALAELLARALPAKGAEPVATGIDDQGWWQYHRRDGMALLLTGRPAARFVSADYRSDSGAYRGELIQALMAQARPARYQLDYGYRGDPLSEHAGGIFRR